MGKTSNQHDNREVLETHPRLTTFDYSTQQRHDMWIAKSYAGRNR